MKYLDRDLSWLSFNGRILQEIASKDVPLLERLKFVAIYSSNLEEFYKVRVASHRFAQKYKGDKRNKFGYRPSFILQQINTIVSEQQAYLGKLFFNEIVPEMTNEGIRFLCGVVNEADQKLLEQYYDKHFKEEFKVLEITNDIFLELKNQAIYQLIIDGEQQYLLEMDYARWGRFITLEQNEDYTKIVQVDDVFKYNLHKILGHEAETYAFKISRDAELYIDEEQDENIVKKIKKSLKKRDTGLPCRLLFNENIPFKHINSLRKKLDLDMASLIAGGNYHNYYDFFGFPEFEHKPHLYYRRDKEIACKSLDNSLDWYQTIGVKDVFLSYPYQSFDYVTRFLKQAAEDEAVEEISTTLYRVSKGSEVGMALEKAAKSGKNVFVLSEVLARFDEESNIYWGERLEQAGAVVKYGIDKLKVHAKVFLIKRRENGVLKSYAYLGTGNLNEKTARIYADHGILTADERYTKDLDEVFKFLKDEQYEPHFKHLLVAPFVLRTKVKKAIRKVMEKAKAGAEQQLHIKLNSLEDPEMIDLIREAADAGVKFQMVVRGICCYCPLTEKQKKNVTIVSVIDKYLEHTRIYQLSEKETYLASADWMTRNLSSRVEIAFPIWDASVRGLLLKQINYQSNDAKKARLITPEGDNQLVKGNNKLSSQQYMFELVANL
ncbi:polyphosphate kinase 1 [Carboxylicivirga sp. A043]|uniref:polyphosphate kinase 1 n=1 Tax=Carboxylicivirga litoralis TaxID=2816963 RepID=UPI0021CB41DB|nr:polyphosphate kinase 1 [Carboxylicivirga sp. A043]MCU4157344.1 polyphosphate kinase 1 [Carboxylicivirga sp. A043]